MEHLNDRQLNEYAEALLPDDEDRAVAAHLAGCAECQERLENLGAVSAWLALLPEAEPAVDLAPLVMTRLAGARPAPLDRAALPRWLAPLLLAQTVLGGLLLLLAWPLAGRLIARPASFFTGRLPEPGALIAEIGASWSGLTAGWTWPALTLPAGVGLALGPALGLLLLAFLLGLLGNRVLLRQWE